MYRTVHLEFVVQVVYINVSAFAFVVEIIDANPVAPVESPRKVVGGCRIEMPAVRTV